MAKKKLTKAQEKALDRDHDGEAGGSLPRGYIDAEEIQLRESVFGY